MKNSRQIFGVAIAVCIAWGAADAVCAQDDLVDLVVGLLHDPDKDMQALALEQVRTDVPGAAATQRFAGLLIELSPESQIALLSALSDRGDSSAAPNVRALLQSNDQLQLRAAAIKAIGNLGDSSDVPQLAAYLDSGEPSEQSAARRSLTVLSGEGASSSIVTEMNKQPASVRVALLEILTARRARDAAPAILKAAIGDDPAVRGAAMASLGQLAGAEHIAGMVQGVLKAERGRERDAAEKAVMLACRRSAEPDQRADPLLDAIDKLPEADRILLLPALGRVGGPDALKVVEQAVSDSDSAVHDAGLRALCNWPDASIAPRLVELAKTEATPGQRRMAVRALIRVAPLPDDRSNEQRLETLQTAMGLCQQDPDRIAALVRAKAIRSAETLRFVATYLDEPVFAEQACLTIVELAHHSGLREAHREEFHRALDRVIEISQDPVVVDRAQRYKKGQTWLRPKPSGR